MMLSRYSQSISAVSAISSSPDSAASVMISSMIASPFCANALNVRNIKENMKKVCRIIRSTI